MNFKIFFLVILIILSISCSFINEDDGYSTGYYIFSILRVGDDSIKVIVDSTLSIKDSLNFKNNFVFDAIVKIDGESLSVESLDVDSFGYKYFYSLDKTVLPEKSYEIEVKVKDKIFTARSVTPKKINFSSYSDSSVLKIDSSLVLEWNSSGIGFYMLQINQKNEYGSFYFFEIGVQNDTFFSLSKLSYLFPDSGTYDFYIISYDSSYFNYLTDQNYSSFNDGYGLFGSVSVGSLKEVKLLK
ncbi:MAG: hypothetical protein XD76_1332 [candidate division TA06 bacterium 32_111]|uniref:DUF4249 family protein n=1 Tax=candidate division TA06 bacterium 34_109 TaxID=1635277 RepID=A0A101I1B2_UNCT6|nr:MAG: hypothetical protein XD76_1332 [candidate division TA06 bacterium 32_111]KUK86956.1 MAG: hypothetical protein XE03_1174 [candidate division TA06 bacterium 34_109]HCP16091.1 hypothetical protein [candidate division WOR-3 bacterium]